MARKEKDGLTMAQAATTETTPGLTPAEIGILRRIAARPPEEIDNLFRLAALPLERVDRGLRAAERGEKRAELSAMIAKVQGRISEREQAKEGELAAMRGRHQEVMRPLYDAQKALAAEQDAELPDLAAVLAQVDAG